MPGLTKPSHWLILILVLLLLFGAKKLPDLARSIGQSMKIFKKEIKDLSDDDTPAQPYSQPNEPTHPGPAAPHSAPSDPSPTSPGDQSHRGGGAA